MRTTHKPQSWPALIVGRRIVSTLGNASGYGSVGGSTNAWFHLGDASRRTVSFPIVTAGLICVNAFVFVLELIGGDVRTTGAENDMQQATNLARQMVTRWGMSDKVGPMSLGGQKNPYLASDVGGKPYSEAFAQLVDTEVQRILRENYAAAVRLLQENRPALDALADALIEHETLDRDAILNVTGLGWAPHIAAQKNGRAVPAAAAVAIGVVA